MSSPSHQPEAAARATSARAAASGWSKTAPPSPLRRFLESGLLFLATILVLRSLALEPFGVPTGSMAATLLGNHKACDCPRCGTRTFVGTSSDPRAANGAACPNCGCTDLHLERVAETVGDRLLVDKLVFDFRKPRRWEVAVFRNPNDDDKPYVKRVVGLPGERVQIREGDVYANDELMRKTLRDALAVKVPLFEQARHPSGGWKSRWLAGDPRPILPGSRLDTPPVDDSLDGSDLVWADQQPAEPRWLTYRNWLLDDKIEEPVQDPLPYNGNHRHERAPVHDFLVEFELDVTAGSGSFTIVLRDGRDEVAAELTFGASGLEAAQLTQPSDRLVRTGTVQRASERRRHRIAFAFVDRRASLSIDGREVGAALDLPAKTGRAPVSRPVALGCRGLTARVRDFRLSRDIHYAASGRNAIGEPWPLGQDEYFLLGDNSANSTDSRLWLKPGIPEANFLGRPLLMHQPTRWSRVFDRDVSFIDWDRVRWIR